MLWQNIYLRCRIYSFLQFKVLLNTYFVKSNAVHEQDDPKIHAVVEKLLDVLNTPSEAVQRAVSDCLSPLMPSKLVINTFCYTTMLGFLTC